MLECQRTDCLSDFAPCIAFIALRVALEDFVLQLLFCLNQRLYCDMYTCKLLKIRDAPKLAREGCWTNAGCGLRVYLGNKGSPLPISVISTPLDSFASPFVCEVGATGEVGLPYSGSQTRVLQSLDVDPRSLHVVSSTPLC
jgi:hypothetical protein